MTQLDRLLNFLDTYHPMNPAKASAVSALNHRARRQPTPGLLLELADTLECAPFVLRNGVVKPLPGLARNLRQCAGSGQY